MYASNHVHALKCSNVLPHYETLKRPLQRFAKIRFLKAIPPDSPSVPSDRVDLFMRWLLARLPPKSDARARAHSESFGKTEQACSLVFRAKCFWSAMRPRIAFIAQNRFFTSQTKRQTLSQAAAQTSTTPVHNTASPENFRDWRIDR